MGSNRGFYMEAGDLSSISLFQAVPSENRNFSDSRNPGLLYYFYFPLSMSLFEPLPLCQKRNVAVERVQRGLFL